jgi:hypothetical protein
MTIVHLLPAVDILIFKIFFNFLNTDVFANIYKDT